MLEKELEQYYREVENALIGTKAEKQDFLIGWQKGIAEYISENPECTVEQIRSLYGTPDDIAATYISVAKPDVVQKGMKIKKRVTALIVATGLLILAIIAWFVLSEHIANNSYRNGYYVRTVIDGNDGPSASISSSIRIE